jgi:hypothetical protein
MVVYNGARYLGQAVDSVLSQTLTDFRFIIVDDASTDDTPGILAEAAAKDDRIQIITNLKNVGPYPSANIGLREVTAPLVARLDSDDICAPERLAEQVSFLHSHPEHLLVGSSFRCIDAEGKVLFERSKPLDDFAVRWIARFGIPMTHPAICFRTKLKNGEPVLYNESFAVAQDYDLIVKLLTHGKAAVLGALHVDYRMHDLNISTTRRELQRRTLRSVAQSHLEHSLPAPLVEQLSDFLDVYQRQNAATAENLTKTIGAFRAMLTLDIKAEPERKRWFMRQSAGLLSEAFLISAVSQRSPGLLVAFLWKARAWLPALIARYFEYKGWMPAAFRVDPNELF